MSLSLPSYFQRRRIQQAVQDRQDVEQPGANIYTSSPDLTDNELEKSKEQEDGHDTGQLEAGPTPNEPTTDSQEFIIITFDGDNDPENPRNWPIKKKIITSIVCFAGWIGAWASAADSTVIPQAKAAFGVSDVAESLATGLFLIAFGIGTLFSGPFSETVGRTPIYIISLLIFMICILISALAPNLGVQLAFRSLAGLFGSSSVTTYPGTIADIWELSQRDLVLTIGSGFQFSMVFISPVVGAYIGESKTLTWRWTEWITLILAGCIVSSVFLLAPETYPPTILSWKAAALRKQTGDQRYRTDQELKLEPLAIRLFHSIYRPFDMLVHELSVMLFTLYLTVSYMISFAFLTGYTYIYTDIYKLSQSHTGLCFFGLVVGILMAAAIGVPLHYHYNAMLAAAKARGQRALPPERRLYYAMLAAPLLPVGLFWMAWTSYRSISLWSSLAGSTLVGFNFVGILLSSYLYLIDSYERYAASALSVAAVVRYVVAGIMVPVSIPMFENLGVHWALTLLGCIALVLTPVPFVMYAYGDEIRRRSRDASKSFEN